MFFKKIDGGKQRLSFPEQGRSVVLTVILSNKRGEKIEVFKNVISYKKVSYRKGRREHSFELP